MMWLSRNTKEMDCFPPHKWEVNACSMRSGYSVFRSLTYSLVSATSTNDVPTIQGKRIMDCTQLHASIR